MSKNTNTKQEAETTTVCTEIPMLTVTHLLGCLADFSANQDQIEKDLVKINTGLTKIETGLAEINADLAEIKINTAKINADLAKIDADIAEKIKPNIKSIDHRLTNLESRIYYNKFVTFGIMGAFSCGSYFLGRKIYRKFGGILSEAISETAKRSREQRFKNNP